MTVFLQLLGSPRVRIGHRWSALSFDRPTALLVYLAMRADWVARAELRSLFWPETDEATAQSNLRQLLVRARNLPFAEPLEIEPRRVRYLVATDIEHFRRHMANSKWQDALRVYRGEFCAGCILHDTPADADWLGRERERLRAEWRQATLALIGELEQTWDHLRAAETARLLLEADPLDEDAVLAFVRASAAAGRREAALECYVRFETDLREELGLEPMEATRELVGAIRAGRSNNHLATSPGEPAKSTPARACPGQRHTPGRALEWAMLEHDWTTHQTVFIVGEAGIGKSRLMLDFAATKGPYTQFRGRPGDLCAPFAAVVRHLRDRLTAQPTLELPAWVRATLAELLPELESPGAPSAGPSPRLRLFDAITQAVLLAERDCQALLIDDAHHLDAQSLELAAYAATAAAERQGSPLKALITYRPEEATPALRSFVRRFVTSGQAALVELGPLATDGIRDMLHELEWSVTETSLETLASFTGGNPFFIAQAVQAMRANPSICLATLPLPEPALRLVEARLERLSTPALQLARLAALAGNAFGPPLAEAVLDVSSRALGELLEELEAAELIEAHSFKAGLIERAVLETMPSTARAHLHLRIAEALERQGTDASGAQAHRQQALEPLSRMTEPVLS